jgi:hypothetical protein
VFLLTPVMRGDGADLRRALEQQLVLEERARFRCGAAFDSWGIGQRVVAIRLRMPAVASPAATSGPRNACASAFSFLRAQRGSDAVLARAPAERDRSIGQSALRFGDLSVCENRGLQSIANAELPKREGLVVLDRADSQTQQARNLLVGQPP